MLEALTKEYERLPKIHIFGISTLFVLAALTFLFPQIGQRSTVLGVSAEPQVELVSTAPDMPIAINNSGAPYVTGESVIAFDMDSSMLLYEKNPNKQVLPASTTKIITALVSLEHYDLSQVLTVPTIAIPGSKMNLISGEQITVESLVKGLLITSANDAAEVLAHNYPGGRYAFIQQMNEKGDQLNLTHTNFTNPTGFDDDNQYSTARDMVRAATEAMKIPMFRQIVSQKESVVFSVDGSIIHPLETTNELLGEVEGVLGVKTGWTEAAQENLVTYYSHDGKNIMVAVLGSRDRFGDTKKLIEWILGNYSWSPAGS